MTHIIKKCIRCKNELDHNIRHVLYRANGEDVIGARCKSCQREIWVEMWGNPQDIDRVIEICE